MCGDARTTELTTSFLRALQEHVLSTRVLHYTATELLFECKTSYRCECMPNRKAWPTTPSLIPKAVSSKKTNAVYEAWQHIVEKYSARDLTVPGDKLPAISGIAAKIRKATHSEYLAGLWKSNLASDLLWNAAPLDLTKPGYYKMEAWRAPSYSWASLDTVVTYTTLDEEERETFLPTISLQAFSITPTGLNPLGTVSAASITIRGPVLEAMMCAEQDRKNWKYALLIKGTSSVPVTPDCLLVPTSFKTESSGEMQNTVRRAHSGEDASEFKAPVLCISVARYDNIVTGLVLGISERSPDAWERIGTFATGTEVVQNAKERDMTIE